MSDRTHPRLIVALVLYACTLAVLALILSWHGIVAQGTLVTIRLTAGGFQPPQVTVRVGTTVEIVNDTAAVQTVTARKQFNVYLPKSLVIALKHRAIDEGLSMSAFVEKLGRRYLEEEER